MSARVLALALGAACTTDVTVGAPSNVVEVATFPAAPSHELDVLFLIDDSSSADIELNLRTALPAFTGALAAVPGGLPDLHIGVATSDLGTTGSLAPDRPGPEIGQVGNGGCAGRGTDGALQHGTAAGAVADPFLIDVSDGAGGRTRNYQGALADVLGGMVSVGAGGCGFEQDLRAMQRALAATAGFVRPAASLAVVIVGDEDDCSIRDAAVLSSTDPVLGPLTSFHRCTQHAVACAEDLDSTGPKTRCASREDSSYLDAIGPIADALRAQKPPARVAVAGILGPPQPFAVELRAAPDQLALSHACMYTGANGLVAADPAVRLADFVARFGPLGAFTEVCARDLRPQLIEIARTTKQLLGIACLDTARLADTRDLPGVQPACEVHDVRDGLAALLPRCPADGDCYELVADDAACPETADHLRVAITRTAPAGGHVEVFCEATR
jgi:hypothetical protein